MFTAANQGSVQVITADVVRQTVMRTEAARAFCSTQPALDCKAFLFESDDGLIDRIELWDGDEVQREEFLTALTQELNC